MSYLRFSDAEFAGKRKQTRHEAFLAEMDVVVPWARFMVFMPMYPNVRRPYMLEMMLCIHIMHQWFALSDPTMEETLYDSTLRHQFLGLGLACDSVPDEATILNFDHLLERNQLAGRLLAEINAVLAECGLLLRRDAFVDATIIKAPSSTKNIAGQREPEMCQTKKGNLWPLACRCTSVWMPNRARCIRSRVPARTCIM